MKRFARNMSLAVAAVVICGLCLPAAVAQAAPNTVKVTQNAAAVGRYEIYELTMENGTHYENPWEDPAITAVFTSPTGRTYTVGGFLYDAKNQTNTWKVRFAPQAVGAWTWSLSFANTLDKNPPFVTTGKFTCTNSANSGLLRVHPCNNGRFMTEGDGQVFYPLGDVYWTYPPRNYTSVHQTFWPTDNSYQPTDVDDFMLASANSGQNITRFNAGYFLELIDEKRGFNINGSGKNNYEVNLGKFIDSYMKSTHRVHIKFAMGFCGEGKAPAQYLGGDYNNLKNDSAIGRSWLNYTKYVIDRYGAYVDIWDLFTGVRGEVSARYLDTIIAYLHAHDPYQHLIMASPSVHAGLDICSAPSILSMTDLDLGPSSAHTTMENLKKVQVNSSTGLVQPLLMENGPHYECSTMTAYLPDRVRNRLVNWAIFFNRGACLRNEVGVGAYSARKRAFEKIFTDYIANFDPAAKPVSVALTPADQLAGYALSSPVDLGLYIVHITSQHSVVSGATVEVNLPADNMKGQWLDPATGISLQQPLALKAGLQKISIPPFKNDIALRLHVGGPAQTLQFDNSCYHVNSDQSSVSLTVNRLGDSSGAVTVNYATRDSMARAGTLYKATTGTLSWGANDTGPKTITVPLINTGLLHADSDFLVDLSQPSGGAGLGTAHSALVNILNVVINTVERLEPTYVVTNGAGKINFTLKRIGKGVGPLTIPYGTRAQSAKPGIDYVEIEQWGKNVLVWADGDMSPKTFSVTILNNPAASGDKEFELNLPDFYGGGDLPVEYHTTADMVAGSTHPDFAHSMIVIQADPKLSPGVLRFSGDFKGYVDNHLFQFVPNYKVPASKEFALIPISRTNGSHGAVSVDYKIVYGSAAANVNYTPVKGTVAWADGDSADKIIRLPLINNPAETGELSVWFEFKPPTGGAHWGLVTGVGRGYLNSVRAVVTIVYPESR